MTIASPDFEANLNRILARNLDPAVPPDLARRIVVRTTSLPQFARADDCRDRFAGRKPVGFVLVRRTGWPSLPVGAGIAASLALLLVAQNQRSLPSADVSSHKVAAELASAGGIVEWRDVSATGPNMVAETSAHAATAPTRSLAVGTTSARSPLGKSNGQGHGDVSSAAVAQHDPERVGEMMVAELKLARGSPAVDGFTLAGDLPAPAPVYGPAHEPDGQWSRVGSTSPSSSSAGLALMPSTASRSVLGR